MEYYNIGGGSITLKLDLYRRHTISIGTIYVERERERVNISEKKGKVIR